MISFIRGGATAPPSVQPLGSRSAVLAVAALFVAGLMLNVDGRAGAQGPPAEQPARPTGLTGSVTHESVVLSWNDPGDTTITGYQILRREPAIHEPGEFIAHLDNTGSAAPSYVDTDVEAGALYVYRVKARNSAGLSQQSSYFNAHLPDAPDPPAALPGPPTSLTATAAGETLITLSWSAPETVEASSILGYRIEVSDDGETGWTHLSAHTASTATTYAHSDLVPGTARHYRVSVITSTGTGAASRVASATTHDRTAPSLLSGAVGASGDTLELAFDEPLDLGADKAPLASAFTVTADGASVAVGAVQAVAGASGSIRLAGLTPAITQGQKVLVSYTDPSSDDDEAAAQDLAGNDAASFNGQGVTNQSTVPAAGASLSATTEQQIGELLAAKAGRTSAQRKVSSRLLDAAEAEQAVGAGDSEGKTAPASGAEDGDGQPEGESPAIGRKLAPADGEDGFEAVTVDIRADVTDAVLGRIHTLGGAVIQ